MTKTTKTATPSKAAKSKAIKASANSKASSNGKVTAASKAQRKPRILPEGWLPKAQIRILSALAKVNGGLNRQDLSEAASVPATHIMGFCVTQYATKKFKTLAAHGYLSSQEVTIDGGRPERIFKITAAGRKAINKIEAGKN